MFNNIAWLAISSVAALALAPVAPIAVVGTSIFIIGTLCFPFGEKRGYTDGFGNPLDK